jgi:hypothetical protein
MSTSKPNDSSQQRLLATSNSGVVYTNTLGQMYITDTDVARPLPLSSNQLAAHANSLVEAP